jgi:hypothetical protein
MAFKCFQLDRTDKKQAMAKHHHKRSIAWISAGASLFLAALALWNIPLCNDWERIDKSTGARKGCRQWFIGLKTGDWYQTSALEQFMLTHHPRELQRNWLVYTIDKKNFVGATIAHGRGSPGPIIRLNDQVLANYLAAIDDSEKKTLYELLASGGEWAIDAKINEIYTKVLNSK